MRRKLVSIFAVLFIVPKVALVVYTQLPASNIDTESVTANSGAGFKAYIDPATGEFMEAPAEPEATLPTNDLSFSSEGLVEEDSPVSGKMINLQGRFQHSYAATVDADGNLAADCDKIENKTTQPNTNEKE